MKPEELSQAVVFAARFEYATQLFSSGIGLGVSLQALGLDPNAPLPLGVRPIENPARVREYWADVMPPGTPAHDYPKEWCGALCLFSLHRAELGLDVFWRGGFAARCLRQLEPHELPAPGDLAYFKRYQHHAIVEAVNAEAGTFDSVDGNQGPGILRHAGRKLSAVAAFYSIEPLIRAKGDEDGTAVERGSV